MADEQIVAIDARSRSCLRFPAPAEVFVLEQAVPADLERDEFDDTAAHLAALRDGEVIGTLRILISDTTAKSAAWRCGIGAKARHRLATVTSRQRNRLAEGRSAKSPCMRSSTPRNSTGAGYREEGEIFEEAGIAHVSMRMSLT